MVFPPKGRRAGLKHRGQRQAPEQARDICKADCISEQPLAEIVPEQIPEQNPPTIPNMPANMGYLIPAGSVPMEVSDESPGVTQESNNRTPCSTRRVTRQQLAHEEQHDNDNDGFSVGVSSLQNGYIDFEDVQLQ